MSGKSLWPLGFAAAFLATLPVQGATLQHAYEFNGSTVEDSVGGVGGTLEGGASISGGKLHLDGTSGYVQLDDYLLPTSGEFSIYLSYTSSSDSFLAELISQGYSGEPGFYLGWLVGQMRIGDANGWTGVYAPRDGNQHDLLLTTGDGSTNLYLDGSLAYSTGGDVNPGVPLGGTQTRIGRQFGSNGEYYSGEIDAARFFSGIATYEEAVQSPPASNDPTLTAAVPEPASWAMIVGGFGLVGGALRRRLRISFSVG